MKLAALNHPTNFNSLILVRTRRCIDAVRIETQYVDYISGHYQRPQPRRIEHVEDQTTVGQLAQKTEADMLKYRNFGKKSLNEIKSKLLELGLTLGMTIDSVLLDEPVAQG